MEISQSSSPFPKKSLNPPKRTKPKRQKLLTMENRNNKFLQHK